MDSDLFLQACGLLFVFPVVVLPEHERKDRGRKWW